MNVIHISRGIWKMPSDKDGALESVIFNLSKNMTELGHNVTIIDRLYSKNDSDMEHFNKIKICRVNAQQIKSEKLLKKIPFIINELNHISYILSVSKYIRKNNGKIDAIHIHSVLMGFLLVLLNRKQRNKIYYTTHSNVFFRSGSDLTYMAKFNLNLNFFIVKRTKKTISLTEQVKLLCIKNGGINPEKIEVIPNGVDLQLFNPDHDIKNIKQKYDLDGKITILFVGRIHKIKGIEYLVKAANIITNENNYGNIRFLLVGPVENTGIDKLVYEDIIFLIKSLNLEENVRLTGSIPFNDLQKLYTACDIFVLPSLAEAFGLVITEAMASEKPVVASKTDGALRQIRDKWNGFLVETADEIDLAEKIKFLIDNNDCRHQFGLNGRYLAESEFDWKIIAEKNLEVYRLD